MPSQGWICYQRTKWDQSSEVSTADQSGSSIFRLLLLIFRLLSTFPALALSVRLSSNILQKRPTKLSESNNIPKTRKRLWRWRFNSIFVFPPRNALSYWSNAIHALPDPRRREREKKDATYRDTCGCEKRSAPVVGRIAEAPWPSRVTWQSVN